MSHPKGCSVCGAFWHTRTRCPVLHEDRADRSTDQERRQHHGRVHWSSWMRERWWVVGVADPEMVTR